MHFGFGSSTMSKIAQPHCCALNPYLLVYSVFLSSSVTQPGPEYCCAQIAVQRCSWGKLQCCALSVPTELSDCPLLLAVSDLAHPVTPLPNGASVFIYGWGIQNETDWEAPVSGLRGLATETVNCSSGVNRILQRILGGRWQSGQPKFLCLGTSAAIGAPCGSDSGGDGMSTYMENSIIYAD